jgi:hypothetical protein
LGLSQFPILAKRRYTLPALLLLGYQNPPLRQGLLSALIHAPSLPQSALADKMWFRYRSPQEPNVTSDAVADYAKARQVDKKTFLKDGR